MIEKFIKIENVGRFNNCYPKGDVTFRKYTLIFADNALGKTTFCAILRSLSTGDNELISSRKTLGSDNPPFVNLLVNGQALVFENESWSDIKPNIRIFDSDFINNNVYSGDYVDNQHRKNLYRIIIGSTGVSLAKKIDKFYLDIRGANSKIGTKKTALSSYLPANVMIDEYIDWKPIENIDVKIKQKEEEIEKLQKALKKKSEIINKNTLEKITLPEFSPKFTPILEKHLKDIEVGAEEKVKKQIAEFKMGFQGESWLSQGITYVSGENCPFCGQSLLNANDIITAYRSHFNKDYKALKREVVELPNIIKSSIGELSLKQVQQHIANNTALLEFWKQFFDLNVPELNFDNIWHKYNELSKIATQLAKKKLQSPVTPTSPESDFNDAIKGVEDLQVSIQAYNKVIENVNNQINEQKTLAKQGGDIDQLIKEHDKLKINKKRFDTAIVKACQEYLGAVKEKSDLELDKINAKQELNEYCEQIMKKYEGEINHYLDLFNTGFRIVNTHYNYKGGTPSSHYMIQINDHTVELGSPKTIGIPTFKTTLSSGDRSALALAFFFAAVYQDFGLEEKFVIFDDPFTSQDRFRRTCTQQLLNKLTDHVKQVIILSHDPYFLKLIEETYVNKDMQTLQLHSSGRNNTTIAEWDIHEETQPIYLKHYGTLLNYYNDSTGKPLDVAMAIRPFLESWLRSHFPKRFKNNQWLGDFIGKIRDADDKDGLSHAKADLSELEAINDYSKKFHHDQNPNASSETVNDSELHGFVKRTLRLVGGSF